LGQQYLDRPRLLFEGIFWREVPPWFGIEAQPADRNRLPNTIPPPMSDSAAAAPAVTVSPLWQCIAAATSFVVSVAACVVGYLAFAASGPWIGAPPILHWSARELSATRGRVQPMPDALIIAAPDSSGTVVISLNTTFRARDYPVVAWDAAGIPDDVEATLLWYSDIDSSRVFRHPLSVEDGRIAPARVAQDPGWLGRIGGLALVLRGSFANPIAVRGAAAKPMSAIQVAGERLREWLEFEPWTGASINGFATPQENDHLPLLAVLGTVTALATLIYAGLWWWKSRSFAPAALGGLVAIFLAAWVVADARWQWNLARQARATRTFYGGKTWEERHRVAEDGALFAFIDRVRNKLPPPPARVFVAADLPYFRARAAYHLYPYDVYYDAASGAIPPPDVLRKGDYLVVYQRRGVQYEAGEHRLRWDGYGPVDADLVIADAGAALFQVR
jgi:hypothetical protein